MCLNGWSFLNRDTKWRISISGFIALYSITYGCVIPRIKRPHAKFVTYDRILHRLRCRILFKSWYQHGNSTSVSNSIYQSRSHCRVDEVTGFECWQKCRLCVDCVSRVIIFCLSDKMNKYTSRQLHKAAFYLPKKRSITSNLVCPPPL